MKSQLELQYWQEHGISEYDDIVVDGKFKNLKLGYVHAYCQEKYKLDLVYLRRTLDTREKFKIFIKSLVFNNETFNDRVAKAIFNLPWVSSALIQFSTCPTTNPFEALYWLMNDLEDYPKCCKHCGKRITKFISFNKNYLADYCSLSCSNNNTEVWAKKLQTNKVRYGVDYVFKAESIKQKIKDRIFEKYGANHNMQVPEIFEKNQQSNYSKKAYTLPSGKIINLMGYEVNVLTWLLNKEFNEDDFDFESKPSIKYQFDDKDKIYFPDFYVKTNNTIIEVKSIWTYYLDYEKNQAKKIGTIAAGYKFRFIIWDEKNQCQLSDSDIEQQLAHLRASHCPECHKILKPTRYSKRYCSRACANKNTQRSDFKREVLAFIRENATCDVIENTLVINQRVNAWIPKLKLAFTLVRPNEVATHILQPASKPDWVLNAAKFKEQGILNLVIFEHDWMKNKTNWMQLIKSKLRVLPKVFARKCIVQQITADKSRAFLNENHSQGFCRAKIHLGAFYCGELLAVMSFDKPRFSTDAEWELIRYSSCFTIVGGFSKLLAHFRKKYSTGSIISYADKTRSIGNVYEQNGFIFTHSTPPVGMFVRKQKILTRFDVYDRNLKKVLETVDENLSVLENLAANGYKRFWNCGSLAYILR